MLTDKTNLSFRSTLLFAALTFSSIGFSAEPADIYQQAIAASQRPAEDVTRDITRKPGKVLKFFDIQPGMKVLDLFSGAGYYTEIVSRVVGTTGAVDAHNNTPYINYIGAEKLAKRYADDRLSNVSQLLQEANTMDLCQGCYDRVLVILTFHDLYHIDEKNGWNKINAPALIAKLKASLKPDGLLGLVDHVAPAGAPEETGNTTHRIDPQLIRDKMSKWGFVLVDEADFLRNPQDQGNLPMWDPSVRGKTDRVVMKFKVEN